MDLIFSPPCPGGDAIALSEGPGEMKLVGISAQLSDVADGGAAGFHQFRGFGQTHTDQEFLPPNNT